MDLVSLCGSLSIRALETILSSLSDSDLQNVAKIENWEILISRVSPRFWFSRAIRTEPVFKIISSEYDQLNLRQVPTISSSEMKIQKEYSIFCNLSSVYTHAFQMHELDFN